ncbi:MAG: rhomboid family intramembrane serine protease [bacterium]|nr:rhomboid family intramembrane serine protease [bacterium]
MIEQPWAPVEIFHARVRKPCSERQLVLQALGIPSEILQVAGGFSLTVAQAQAQRATSELELYREENIDWPPPKIDAPMLSRGVAGAVVYAILLIVLYPIGTSGLAGRNWWEAGKLVAARVESGEWWRAWTALTLHGSLPHIAGNVVFGVMFGVLAAHSLGVGLTWLGTVLAGGFGNIVNARIQDGAHTSIGASTAVFGALGLLVTYEWVRRERLHQSPMRRLAPILAGCVLLGFLGMGSPGSNTDVMAHVTGFGAGHVLGFVTGKLQLPDRLPVNAQYALAALALAIIGVAWWIALTA